MNMKTNFRKEEENSSEFDEAANSNTENLTQKEFEEYIMKSGAKGSFMIYRSDKKNEELGLEEL